MVDRINQLERQVEALRQDLTYFYEGDNKAAGARARKKLQALKVWAQEVRVEIQEIKNR